MDSTRKPGRRQSVVNAALWYKNLGFSVIPLKPKSKKPATASWKQFQEKRPDQKQIETWWPDCSTRGVAIVCGTVSGNLVVRDFDTPGAYEAWAASHPDLAKMLPTVKTARGHHVYFRCPGLRIVPLSDGELRSDGSYVAAPPSQHPSGQNYEWVVPIGREIPAIDDPVAVGLAPPKSVPTLNQCYREDGDNGGVQKTTEAVGGGGVGVARDGVFAGDRDAGASAVLPGVQPNPAVSSEDVDDIIERTLPTGPSQRNGSVFLLARTLKGHPAYADASSRDLGWIVKKWHKTGLQRGVIATQAWEESFADFVAAWPKVKFPAGNDPMTRLKEQLVEQPWPRTALKFEHEPVQRLVAVCCFLQRLVGKDVFFLACRTAQKLAGFTNHVEAARYLKMLVGTEILEITDPGNKRRARRYRYLPAD